MEENTNEKTELEERKPKNGTETPAIRKKKSIGRKLMDKLFSDDPIGVSERVKNEIIWPGLKELSYEIFMSTVSMIFWGEVRGGGRSRPGSRNIRNDRYEDYGRYSDSRGRSQSMPQNHRSSYDYGEIIFRSKEAAEDALAYLRECIDRYNRASVADLNEASELSSKYTDQYHGWYDLRDAGVYPTPDGWMLDLPPTNPLRMH